MVKRIVMVLVMVWGCGAAFAVTQENGQPCPPECVTDSMEIVTWYPSPYSEYEELRLYPTTRGTSYCDGEKKGLLYYDDNNTSMDSSDDKVKVCMGSSAWTGGGWQALGHWGYLTGTTDIAPSNSGAVKIQNLKIDQTTQDGYVLTSDVNGNASWKSVSSTGDTSQTFTSPGTYSFKVPDDISMVYVTAIGGGGVGGTGGRSIGGSASGGYGGEAGKIFTMAPVMVTPGTVYTIIVGNGGVTGTLKGEDTKFGTILTASGGVAGQSAEDGGNPANRGPGGPGQKGKDLNNSIGGEGGGDCRAGSKGNGWGSGGGGGGGEGYGEWNCSERKPGIGGSGAPGMMAIVWY